MWFSLALRINEDVIKIYINEDIEFLRQDLVNITLKHGQSVGQSKRHYLTLKVTIAAFEDLLLLIALSDSNFMICID